MMAETHMRQHIPICDNAETLAGAGTGVRRCSDALGPRKNLHRRVCYGRLISIVVITGIVIERVKRTWLWWIIIICEALS
jgi:hypothetical protein